MNILMLTNTFTPHVGGVARSVSTFAATLRAVGHRVIVAAPEFENMPEKEEGVIRLPSIQNFNGSDFSVAFAIPGQLESQLEGFAPDIVHVHHPFLLGGTGMRVAREYGVPIVFTHHTMYEQYTHYMPGDSAAMREFAAQQATGFANLCNHVIAPSESVMEIMRQRGVTVPITVVPTGVDVDAFAQGARAARRKLHGIPPRALVLGHVGRLAKEKNLPFMAEAASAFIEHHKSARFLVIGGGPAEEEIKGHFVKRGVAERLIMPGKAQGQDLVDAYSAMDAFLFASGSETQGIVLVEAMAAGAPVIAIDAPGAREVVRDKRNGRLLASQDIYSYAKAIEWIAERTPEQRRKMMAAARATARQFSLEASAARLEGVYKACRAADATTERPELGFWESAVEQLKAEWNLAANMTTSFFTALTQSTVEETHD